MTDAKDVLEELETIGAVGGEEPLRLSAEHAELVEKPPVPPESELTPSMSGFTALAESLRRIAEEAHSAALFCEELAGASQERPPSTRELRAVPMPEIVPPPSIPPAEAPKIPPARPPATLTEEQMARVRESARRKIRGDHLSEEDRAHLFGDDPESVAPEISLPSLDPNYPKENQDEVSKEGG